MKVKKFIYAHRTFGTKQQASKVPQFLYVVVISSTTPYICAAELFLRWTL